ncbi:MAG TPA: DUF4276 family protein [Polyangiaceae bacterium]|nr:DUF4276 family protein [Polyangiaceae bacterium]
MIYLCAGLYAEGSSDYRFLSPLVSRLLDAVGARLFPSECEVAETVGIDAPWVKSGRADRFMAAVGRDGEGCTLFVVHTDGAGDPRKARENNVVPSRQALLATGDERPVVACVPVHEVEAWLLTDPEAFRTALGDSAAPALPPEPEREPDPKATLKRLLVESGMRRPPERLFALFGERVRFETLRTLPAFAAFEAEIEAAVRAVARAYGHADHA